MTLVAEAKLLPALVHGEATCAPGTQEPVLVRGAPLLPALGHRVAVSAPVNRTTESRYLLSLVSK